MLALVLVGIGFFLGSRNNPQASATDDTTHAPVILKEVTVNKSFSFPVVDTNGQKVTDITYSISSVDKQNEIIVKGERAKTVQGRTFFIVNLKLLNTSDKTIQLNTRDYIRISVGNAKDLLAADIHNDPVVIQPIATVYTRLGFPIDANETHVTLHVGQLTGSKTDIPVTF